MLTACLPGYANSATNAAAVTMRHVIQLICLLGLVFVGHGAAAQSAGKAGEFEKAIREYLLNNPEVIVEALEKYESRQHQAQQRAAKTALTTHKNILFNHPMTPVSGAKDADVTVVEFFDYQCGFCKRVMKTVLGVLKDDPKVRIVWKEFPILGPTSEFAARAAMAAKRQGKYFDFHVQVMGARGQLSAQKILRLAAKVGIDTDRLKRDMADPEITKYLADTARLAQTLGITGTPGFVIGDRIVAGAIDRNRLQELIAAIRNQS
jgi:protein-disulfide isomerase